MSAVQGDRAHDATDRGSPVKIGGKASTSAPAAVADGKRVDGYFAANGRLVVLLDALPTAAAGADSAANPTTPIVGAAALLFNGTTWEREYTSTTGTALASAARTASIDTADIANYSARGLHVVIDATAVTATPSITVTIQGKDSLSGQYYTILAAAAITAVSTTVLRVYPGLTAAANLVANDVLPRNWRVSVAAADADSITYSVGYTMLR